MKVSVSWSGGKDCCLALFEILQSKQYDIHSLHTTFNKDTGRVGLHGIRRSLIEQQAKCLGLTLNTINVPTAQSNDAYETSMDKYYSELEAQGIRKIVFGDIFLEDLKRYREKMLDRYGLEAIFPLWNRDSRVVAKKFITAGFKAMICAADSRHFNAADVGRAFDLEFINSLGPAIDPCGEKGEFHTFVYDGPIFDNGIHLQQHQAEEKEYHFKVNLADGRSESRSSKFWFRELS